MQKMKKVVSALAAGTMLASMTAFSVSAADEVTVAQMQSALDEMAVTQDAMYADAIARTQEMLDDTGESSEPFYYPYYSTYSNLEISGTQHYLAAIPNYNQTLSSNFGVYFYVNTNILPNAPIEKSNFKIGSGYANGMELRNVTINSEDYERKKIMARFIKNDSITKTSELFTYPLGNAGNLSIVGSELELHHLTNPNAALETTMLTSTVGSSCTFEKCVYSLGDVNRDGLITTDDSQAVLSRLVHLSKPSRNDEFGGYYDAIAFELAADFDEDGAITIQDAVGINQYIAKNGG